MPIYTFECSCGTVTDEIFRIADRPDRIKCPKCGANARRVLAPGGVQTDGDVKWLESACKVLLRPGEPQLRTRSEWKRYLKDNNLIAAG